MRRLTPAILKGMGLIFWREFDLFKAGLVAGGLGKSVEDLGLDRAVLQVEGVVLLFKLDLVVVDDALLGLELVYY